MKRGYLALLLAASLLTATEIVRGAEPADKLPVLFKIDWTRGNDLEWRYNGGALGIFGDKIVYATGFGRRVPDEIKKRDGYFDGYHKLLGVYDLPTRKWSFDHPPFPGIARAYTTTPINDGQNTLYVLGGQSYIAPHTFKDAYRLTFANDEWKWTQLPDMKRPGAMFAAAEIDGKLYAQGGTYYDHVAGWDATINNVGQRLEVFDQAAIDKGWVDLPPLPGTARSHQAVAAVGGKLYVLGGVQERSTPKADAWNVVDNWVFDPKAQSWKQLRDQPYPLESFSSVVFENRYILLIGGYGGRATIDAKGTVTHAALPDQGFTGRVLVYDTQTDTYGAGTPLPFPMGDTRVIWLERDKTLYFCTAEIDNSQRIPDVYLGTVQFTGDAK